MRRSLLFFSFIILAALPASAQIRPLDPTEVRAWREDLAFLRKEMPARHANLFHDMKRVQFDSALNSRRVSFVVICLRSCKAR